MDHKGIVKAGRLSPVIFGNFPVKNALARLNGEMRLLDAVPQGYLVDTDIATNTPLNFTDGTTAHLGLTVSGGEWVLTPASGANKEAFVELTHAGQTIDATNRFALEATLSFDDTDAKQVIFFGLHAGSPAGALVDYAADPLVLANLQVQGVGILLKAAESADDVKSIFVVKHSGTGDPVIVDTGKTLAATASSRVGLIGDGSGRVQVVVGNSVVKKVSLPGGLSATSKASCILKQQEADVSPLTLGRLLAVAVSA